jgi:hypothetical protein
LLDIWQPIFTVLNTYWSYCGPLSACILVAAFAFRTPAIRFCLLFLLFGAGLWLRIDVLNDPPRYWLPMLSIGFALSAAATVWLLERLHAVPGLSVRLLGRRRGALHLLLIAFLALASIRLLVLSIGLVQRADAFDLLSGGLSRQQFLVQRVRPYRAMDWVNDHAGGTTEVVTLNTSLGYYLQEPYLSDWFGGRLSQLQAGGDAMRSQLAGWCAADVRVAVLNRGVHEYNSDSAADIRPRSSFPWLGTPGLGARLLFSWRGVDVIAVHPCNALPRLR